jgi:RPA family protein
LSAPKNKREVAWRIFAREFNAATIELPGEDQYAPTYLLSPLGALINRVFITGVLTECENIGTEHEPLWRGRISDPTDVFYISAGQFQPKAAQILSELEVPALIGIVGKARTYSPDDNTTYVSIRVEQVKTVTPEFRNYWVLEACNGLSYRLGGMVEALRMDPPNNKELEALGYSTKISSGIIEAINQFGLVPVADYSELLKNTIKELSVENDVIINDSISQDSEFQLAINTVGEVELEHENDSQPASPDTNLTVNNNKSDPEQHAGEKNDKDDSEPDSEVQEKLVFEIITSLVEDNPEGVNYEDVQAHAAEHGLERPQVEEYISSLIEKGIIYEPSIGLFKAV